MRKESDMNCTQTIAIINLLADQLSGFGVPKKHEIEQKTVHIDYLYRIIRRLYNLDI
jgi:hypothetical protein